MEFCRRILKGTVLFTVRNKAISWSLVAVLTLGPPFALQGRTCGAECECRQSVECLCCARRGTTGSSGKGGGCCSELARATTGKSCCSGRETGESHPAGALFVPANDSHTGVCNCRHGDSGPQAPAQEQRDDSRVDLAVAAMNLDGDPERPLISRKLSAFDGFDAGLALMSHSRRQSLLGTWQK